MAKDSCDGCGRTVTVAGGIANIWTFGQDDGSEGTAMTLEFEDGTDHLLCYPCMEVLPDNPTAEDVERLEEVDAETSRLTEY
ncbi:DUF7561 family protein [Natronobacterium gregoryi]|uniref:Small CPxCG-related zinc finger protein n=2 Tax=Natronobacterium gregoryi TaxID=44930 RepID=L0AFM2_NATGS|nr:hypothetical protein [Natronobacterium gregoryi]AFZ72703.1 hypothetical protein Natgr_1494 [Natronobacterium gregoryi SP2]ELY69004.1 hypothetical protein C490_08436 [Natronobacterium gregoryi SP2]PLK20655.1 hypothetical protein CYV19_08645 [Natronobacterium gregoryi SP2]SFI92044.1 hypothetical protein SAMN05443661_10985 [Natronobacterium gregoryi]